MNPSEESEQQITQEKTLRTQMLQMLQDLREGSKPQKITEEEMGMKIANMLGMLPFKRSEIKVRTTHVSQVITTLETWVEFSNLIPDRGPKLELIKDSGSLLLIMQTESFGYKDSILLIEYNTVTNYLKGTDNQRGLLSVLRCVMQNIVYAHLGKREEQEIIKKYLPITQEQKHQARQILHSFRDAPLSEDTTLLAYLFGL